MSRVRIVQLLCPSRHALLATAYESPDGEEILEIAQRLRGAADTAIASGNMNPWCGICRSRSWKTEDRATAFATMAEALPHLVEEERKNAAMREFFRASRG